MSIQLQFLSVVIPISVIEKHYKGGFKQCVDDVAIHIGKTIWFDYDLFREGAMNPSDVEDIVDRWKSLGVNTCEVVNGLPSKWVDVCVVDELWGPTLDCDWLEMDRRSRSVRLKGKEIGEIYGRDKFKPDSYGF